MSTEELNRIVTKWSCHLPAPCSPPSPWLQPHWPPPCSVNTAGLAPLAGLRPHCLPASSQCHLAGPPNQSSSHFLTIFPPSCFISLVHHPGPRLSHYWLVCCLSSDFATRMKHSEHRDLVEATHGCVTRTWHSVNGRGGRRRRELEFEPQHTVAGTQRASCFTTLSFHFLTPRRAGVSVK